MTHDAARGNQTAQVGHRRPSPPLWMRLSVSAPALLVVAGLVGPASVRPALLFASVLAAILSIVGTQRWQATVESAPVTQVDVDQEVARVRRFRRKFYGTLGAVFATWMVVLAIAALLEA